MEKIFLCIHVYNHYNTFTLIDLKYNISPYGSKFVVNRNVFLQDPFYYSIKY